MWIEFFADAEPQRPSHRYFVSTVLIDEDGAVVGLLRATGPKEEFLEAIRVHDAPGYGWRVKDPYFGFSGNLRARFIDNEEDAEIDQPFSEIEFSHGVLRGEVSPRKNAPWTVLAEQLINHYWSPDAFFELDFNYPALAIRGY